MRLDENLPRDVAAMAVAVAVIFSVAGFAVGRLVA